MNESETEPPFLASQLKRKQATSTPSPSLSPLQDESSQATATTAAATISTTQSFSDSMIVRRRGALVDSTAATIITESASETKLMNLQQKWNKLSPKRLFRNASDDDDSNDDVLSNHTEGNVRPSLPQEQLNELELTTSTSSELSSSDHQQLRVLRDRVEQQVQSMSQLLLQSPSSQKRRQRSPGSVDLAMKQFQAVSIQVVSDFLESPQTTPRTRPADSNKNPQQHLAEELQQAKKETEWLRQQLREREEQQNQQEEKGRVALLQQQRSKLQQRIRELLHDTGKLRQERNAFHNQNLKQTHQIQTLHESFTQLQQDKTKSEAMLQQHIAKLQAKSTQLLEELQQARRAQQQEALLRIQIRNDVTQRITSLELEKKRLQRAKRSNVHHHQQSPGVESIHLAPTPLRSQSSEEETVSTATPSSFTNLGGNSSEPSPANDRLEQMKSEVKNRRARIEAIRRKRSDEDKQASPINSHDPVLNNRSPEAMSSSPQTPRIHDPPQLRKFHVETSIDSASGVQSDPMGVTSFLNRIDSAMEASASEFAKETVIVELKQDIVDLQQHNLQLEMGAKEAEEHVSLLETTSTETSMNLLQATEREATLAKELQERTQEGTLAQSSLQDMKRSHQEMLSVRDDELQGQLEQTAKLEHQLSESQAECSELEEQTKRIPELQQRQSELLESVSVYKAQNRAMSSQIDELEMMVVEMEMANGALEDQVRAVDGDLKRQQELISKLSTELRRASSREISSRKELESAGVKHSAQDKEQQQRLQIEVDSLQSILSDVSKQLEEAHQQEEALKVELQRKQKEYQMFISDSGERQACLNRKLQYLEQELGKVKQECETSRSQNKDLREERKSQVMTLAHAEDVQKELAHNLAESEFELERQLNSTAIQENELSRLTAQCLGVSRTVGLSSSRDASPSKTQVSAQRQSLESKLASVSDHLLATSERRLTLERQIQDLHSHFQSYKFGGNNDNRSVGEIVKNRQLKDLERAISKLRKECDQLTSKNTRIQDQNEALKQLLANSEHRRKHVEGKVSEYENELELLREEAVVMEAKSIALQNDRRKLASENEVYWSIEMELESRLADASKLIDSSIPRIKELEKEMQELEKDIEDRDSVLDAMRSENIELVEKVKGLETEKKAVDHECTVLSSRLQTQSQRLDELESSLRSKKEEVETLQSTSIPRIKELEKEMQELEKDIEDRDSVLDAKRSENIGLVEKVKGLETEKKAVDHECTLLSSRLQTQTQRLDELESSLRSKKEEVETLQSKAMTLEVQMLNLDASKGHVGIIKAQILQLSDLKNEVLQQIRRGTAQAQNPDAVVFDIVVELQDLRMVLETAHDHISASRDDFLELERKIDSLNDENAYLTIRNTSLEKITEEQRVRRKEIEQLLSVRIQEMEVSQIENLQIHPIQDRAVPMATVAVASKQTASSDDVYPDSGISQPGRFQVKYIENKSDWFQFKASPARAARAKEDPNVSSDAYEVSDGHFGDDGKHLKQQARSSNMHNGASMKDREKLLREHGLRQQLDLLNNEEAGTTARKSFSPISEIDSQEDMAHKTTWDSLSEVDSQNGSPKNFPPSDDVSDLSHASTLEPYSPYHVHVPQEVKISVVQQAASSQIETLTSAQTFQNLVAPRVTNTAHPEHLSRQQQPPEYSVTLGALSPSPQVPRTDQSSAKNSPLLLVKKTLKF
jgi:chromosome segregation ATPase